VHKKKFMAEYHQARKPEPQKATCLDCSAEISQNPRQGARKRRCADCATARRRELDNERHRQKSEQERLAREAALPAPTFVCQGCEQEFPKTKPGLPPKRCAECRKRASADWAATKRAEARQARPELMFTCQLCQGQSPMPRRGKAPRFCPPCRPLNAQRWHAEWHRRNVSPERGGIACLDCARPLLEEEQPSVGRLRSLCPPCAKVRQRKASNEWHKANPESRQRVHREGRRRRRLARKHVLAERFTDREIFERDGWVCGLCGGLVDGALKYPDQMRASLDHVLPLARGGHHTRRNTRCAHALCNSRKTNRLDTEVVHLFPYLREFYATT
jgi:hypothetical protein